MEDLIIFKRREDDLFGIVNDCFCFSKKDGKTTLKVVYEKTKTTIVEITNVHGLEQYIKVHNLHERKEEIIKWYEEV